MKERVAHLVGSTQLTPKALGTFHGLGAKILRENFQHTNRSQGFTILDTADTERLVKQALDNHKLAVKQWPLRSVRHYISQAKNQLQSPEHMAAQAASEKEETLAALFATYQKLLAQHDGYDFDDLIAETIKMLTVSTNARRQYLERWQYISVDEYQDTNPAQDKMLDLLLNKDQNLCVVGDDYQAIYSWRGAKVEHILHFENKFPNCATIYLTQNYRSTPKIITAANKVIAENRDQKHKELWTDQEEGTPIKLVSLASDRNEARYVRTAIERYIDDGGELGDCAILYRTNAQSRLFEEEFVSHNTPYTIVGGLRFYERAEIKDALAFLQLLVNPKSTLSLKRLVKALAYGVGPKTIDNLYTNDPNASTSLVTAMQSSPVLTERQQKGLLPIVKGLCVPISQPTTVKDILEAMLNASGYWKYLKDQENSEERQENIQELFNVAMGYADVSSFLEATSLMTDADSAPAGGNRVMCMTLHAAKGLEFKNVYIAGCEEGLLPHSNSLNGVADIEEERRLFYVGITRAKERLTITHALERTVYGESTLQLPSRFLEVLADEAEKLSEDEMTMPISKEDASTPTYVTCDIGDMVAHPIFGRGVVIGVEGTLASCIFEGYGIKNIAQSSLLPPS
jgi:DNA helicase-2/ATP-dependent DNA helicase PcrA